MTRALSRAERQRRQWRPASAHQHSVDCYFSEDDLEVVYCTTCGEEW